MGHTNKADHPRERVRTTPQPAQPAGIEPLMVMLRTDGRLIVRDPRRPLGEGTVWLGTQGCGLDAAYRAARELAGLAPL